MSLVESWSLNQTTTVEVAHPGVQGPPGSGGGGAVSSVNGRTGAVLLTSADVGLANVNNTSDASKPVSTAQAAADAAVLASANATTAAHAARTDNPHTVTAAQLGLGNVENKSSATIRSEITSGNVTTALGYTPASASSNTGDETGPRIGTLLHAATAKTTPVDADEVTGLDSAASFGLIRMTWENVKATLKTYFDTLYAAAATLTSHTSATNPHSGSAPTGAVGSTGITMSTARLLGRTTAATGSIEEITVGAGLTLAAGALTATGTGDFKADGTVAMTGALTTNVGTFTSAVANGASAVGFNYNTPAYTTSGAVLARWQNNSVTKVFIDKDGLIWGANNSPFGQRISNAFSVFNTNASFPAVDIAAGFGVINSAALGIVWYSGTYLNSGGANDAGLHRKAAKIIESNAGTAGIYAGSAFTTGSQTVAQLPAAATAGAGARAFVTDATATTFLSVVAGGGANKVPVVCDGTNWLIG